MYFPLNEWIYAAAQSTGHESFRSADRVVHDLILARFGCLEFRHNPAVKHDIGPVGYGKDLRVFTRCIEHTVALLGNLIDQLKDFSLRADVDALVGSSKI